MPTQHTARDRLFTVLLLGMILTGCAPPFPVHETSDTSLRDGFSSSMGLIYGRIVVRGWSSNVRGDYTTSVEFRNRSSGQKFTHQLSRSGAFHWVLRAGRYEITDVWSGLERVSQKAENQGIYFDVVASQATYLGDLLVRLPSLYSAGTVTLLDDFAAATRHLRRRYPSLKLEKAPTKRLFSTPISPR